MYSIRDFVWVDPDYTGGGIYVIQGELSDGTWFMLDYDSLGVDGVLLNADPKAAGEDAFYNEWIDKHLIRFLDEDDPELYSLVTAMLRYLTKHQSDGNYSLGELEDFYRGWDTSSTKSTLSLAKKMAGV